MLRCIFPFCVAFGLALSATAEPAKIAPRPLASALDALGDGRWERAADLAARDGPGAVVLVEWHRLRAGRGSPAEVLAFLEAYPDWPGLERLRARAEPDFAEATDAQVLAFHAGGLPETGAGILRLDRALRAAGQVGDADASVVMAWRSFDLSAEEHADFLAAHAELLAPHHDARLDMTLWRGLRDAELMLPLASDGARAIAEIRQVAASGQRGLDAKIASLPEALRDDPGLAHARFERYLEIDEDEKAIALMRSQSAIDGGLGRADQWAGWRRALSRRMMRAQEYAVAYDLASRHQLVEGSSFADLEWLSGYLALRFLNEPELALDHFQRLRAAVATPISLGRAGYWIGRAQEALGDGDAAQIAYEEGAAHQTSFYGLLAAEKAGLPTDPALAGTETFPDWRGAPFTQAPLFQAAVLAHAAGRLTLSEQLFVALSETQDRAGIGQIAAVLKEMDAPHLQVMLGKAVARRGIVLPEPYYALHPMQEMDLPVPMEMALAIARRESEFDFGVTSGAGAEGLMQLMPGTASDVARDLGLAHERARVLSDWRYNAQLGSTYIAQLSGMFDANVVMISAGYNAGPGRPLRWMEDFGDPRAGGMDIIDWIEHIPFNETRNYIQRVTESLPVYRARLGREALPIPFTQELLGATITVK